MDNWVTTHQMLIFPAVHINIRCVCVFCIQSLCHHTVRGCCQRADSIGLSRALDIVFMKGEGQKATEVSWEFSTHTHSKFVPFVSNVHLVMHLTSCFPPLDDFQNPGLTNTQMYMLSEQTAHIKTREHGVKEAHSTDEANISWCCHTQNFPDCATENNNVVNTNTELRFRANTLLVITRGTFLNVSVSFTASLTYAFIHADVLKEKVNGRWRWLLQMALRFMQQHFWMGNSMNVFNEMTKQISLFFLAMLHLFLLGRKFTLLLKEAYATVEGKGQNENWILFIFCARKYKL